MGFGTIVSKISSFLSLIVLGWFLTKEEFSIYALALSSSIIFCALRNGGIQQILTQRGERGYNLAIDMYFKYALLFNLIAMFLILAVSPLVVSLFNNDTLYYVLAIIALALPMSTSGTLYKVGLIVKLKFSDAAKFDMYSSFLRHGSAALFCVIGFGVFSFVLPLIVVAIFEYIYGKHKTGINLIASKKISLSKFNKIFGHAKWLILSAIFISIALQGDYFVVGLFESGIIVGLYFFGFQIVASVIAIAGQGLQSVVLPIVSKFKNDTERQAKAFVKMIVILTGVVALIAVQVYLFAPYVVNILWNGKWDQSIPVVQIMSISLVTWLLIPLAKSVIESRGQWKIVSFVMAFDAIGIVLAAIIGAALGGLIEIALCVSLFRLAYGCLCAVYVGSLLGVKRRHILKIITVVMLCAIIALFVAQIVTEHFHVTSFPILASINIFIATTIYLVLLYILQKSTLISAMRYFQSMIMAK